MRLIRLVSPNKEAVGEFQNLFPDIRVKPQSKIGLLSASLPLSHKKIEIEVNNNTIGFKTADTEPTFSQAILDNGYYNNGEITDHITKKLNYALSSTKVSNMGFQWNCILDKTNRLEIQYRRGEYLTWEAPITNRKNVKTNSSGTIYSTLAAPTGDNSFAFSSLSLINSCGVFRLRAKTTNKIIMGLFQEQASDLLLSASDLNYGIGINGGNYFHIFNKVEIAPTVAVPAVNNDTLCILLSEGSINLDVYRNDNLLVTLASYPIDLKESYLTGFTLQATATTVDTIRWNPDPRQIQTLDGVTMETDNDMNTENNVENYHLDFNELAVGTIPTPINKTNRRVTLKFYEEEFIQKLGFATLTYKSQLMKHTFRAFNSLDNTTTPNSVIIELPNISLESYDGQTSQRRNIVCIIPTLTKIDNRLIYNASTPIMLNMNNDHEFNLRQVSCRILDLDNELLLLSTPGAEITLLID